MLPSAQLWLTYSFITFKLKRSSSVWFIMQFSSTIQVIVCLLLAQIIIHTHL